jgi:hypothetical protein
MPISSVTTASCTAIPMAGAHACVMAGRKSKKQSLN